METKTKTLIQEAPLMNLNRGNYSMVIRTFLTENIPKENWIEDLLKSLIKNEGKKEVSENQDTVIKEDSDKNLTD